MRLRKSFFSRLTPEPKPCPNCSEAYAQGYKKGFADAVRRYGIKEGVK